MHFIQLRAHLQKYHFDKIRGLCEEIAASVEGLGIQTLNSTQMWDLFPTSLGTDRVLTVLVLMAQGSPPERPNHAPERLSEPLTLPPRVVPLESDSSELEVFYVTGTAGAKSIAKSTDNWWAPESTHQSKTRERTISQTRLTSPLVSRGRKYMPRAQSGTTGCSAQAPKGCTMSPFAKQYR